MVFVPSMFVPLYMGSNRRNEIALLMVTLFTGLVIVGTSYLLRPLRLPRVQISSRLFFMIFTVVTIGLTLWVIAVFRGNLRIVSFSDVYDLRYAAADLARGSLVGYALMWLSGVIGPLLLALGAARGRAFILVAGMLVQILVYSAMGSKSVVVSIVVIPLFYLILRDKGAGFGVKFSWGMSVLLFGLYLLSLVPRSSLLTTVLLLVFLRIFGNSGLMTGQYYYFFQQNPLTYYSHIKGVSWFIHYPYQDAVGLEIGNFYAGAVDYSANAHFWATDGLAALGLPGVLLASFLCALVFWLLDSAASEHDLRFTAPLVSFATLNVTNISIFTSLLSGGLGLLILMLYLMPPQEVPMGNRPKVGNRQLGRAPLRT